MGEGYITMISDWTQEGIKTAIYKQMLSVGGHNLVNVFNWRSGIELWTSLLTNIFCKTKVQEDNRLLDPTTGLFECRGCSHVENASSSKCHSSYSERDVDSF